MRFLPPADDVAKQVVLTLVSVAVALWATPKVKAWLKRKSVINATK